MYTTGRRRRLRRRCFASRLYLTESAHQNIIIIATVVAAHSRRVVVAHSLTSLFIAQTRAKIVVDDECVALYHWTGYSRENHSRFASQNIAEYLPVPEQDVGGGCVDFHSTSARNS